MYNAKETKMSTVTYERWPVTSAMKATLKSYILKQKQKKKEGSVNNLLYRNHFLDDLFSLKKKNRMLY